jgi:putative membrane protein
MKNHVNLWLGAGLLIACMSCNNGAQNDVSDAKDSNNAKIDSTRIDSTHAAVMPATVSKDDAAFVVNAANAGMMEVQLGQQAEQKGVAKDVKAYGAMMVKDHTAAGDKLKMLAASKNITVPAAVSPDMQKDIDDFQNKQGKDFDKAYINKMVDDHKKVITLFENESKNGSDTDIRAFADSTLHTLRTHLSKAEECHKMMM